MIVKYLYILLACCLGTNGLYAQQANKTGSNPSVPFANIIMAAKDNSKTDSFVVSLLKQYPQYFDFILKNKNQLNVQLIYTQVNRGLNGIPALKNYYFNVDSSKYFYPASTVKLPVCLLALQKLGELKDKGITPLTTMITEQGQPTQTQVYNDPATPNGKPTIANYIKKILMVSDNDAYNRLYEFLGRQYINEQLRKKGYADAQVLHRLQIALTDEQNKATNPINFIGNNNKLMYTQPMLYDAAKYQPRNDSIGYGYLSGDSVITGAMDFSGKNRISLEDLHTILLSIVFPNKVTAAKRFNISEEDRNFVLKFMSQLPTESIWPPYAGDTTYWPAYGKFLLYGSEVGAIPKNMRIFNKVGDAYGQLIDVAYIVDFDKKVEFFLSATIYCNSDGILNDDKYDYETAGFPFMKHLGEIFYNYEVKRSKKNEPDLTPLLFNYDGQ